MFQMITFHYPKKFKHYNGKIIKSSFIFQILNTMKKLKSDFETASDQIFSANILFLNIFQE